jgi:hypothetical protein
MPYVKEPSTNFMQEKQKDVSMCLPHLPCNESIIQQSIIIVTNANKASDLPFHLQRGNFCFPVL